MFTYRAIVKKIIDGDTIEVDIDLGFEIIFVDQRIRLYGINAPETRTLDESEKQRGLTAKNRVIELLPVGSEIKINTIKDEKEKYGRYLALVYLPDNRELNKLLLDEGLVKEYYGKNDSDDTGSNNRSSNT